MPNNITLINELNFHDTVLEFIHSRNMRVESYEHMKQVYIKMLESNYFFILNHELKVHLMIDLTYYLHQTQENRQHILECLDIENSDEEDSDDETLSVRHR